MNKRIGRKTGDGGSAPIDWLADRGCGGGSPTYFRFAATVEEEAAFRLYKEKNRKRTIQKSRSIGMSEMSKQDWILKKEVVQGNSAIANDTGKHYRFQMQVAVTQEDAVKGFAVVNLDPFRVADVYGISNFAQQTALKKVLCAGNRGHKDLLQDINDIITALERWKQMLHEDELLVKAIESPRISEQMHSKPEFNSNGGWMCYE